MHKLSDYSQEEIQTVFLRTFKDHSILTLDDISDDAKLRMMSTLAATAIVADMRLRAFASLFMNEVAKIVKRKVK